MIAVFTERDRFLGKQFSCETPLKDLILDNQLLFYNSSLIIANLFFISFKDFIRDEIVKLLLQNSSVYL